MWTFNERLRQHEQFEDHSLEEMEEIEKEEVIEDDSRD